MAVCVENRYDNFDLRYGAIRCDTVPRYLKCRYGTLPVTSVRPSIPYIILVYGVGGDGGTGDFRPFFGAIILRDMFGKGMLAYATRIIENDLFR